MANLSDYEWLTGDEGAQVVSSLGQESRPLHQQLATLQRTLSAPRSRLAVQLVELRARARTKFGDLADQMFFTPELLQECSDGWIARYVAKRFLHCPHVVDYCCGIGGDLTALGDVSQPGRLVGWDKCPIACHLAAANLRAVAPEAAESLELHVGDVKESTPAPGCHWHVDPQRRQANRRTTHLEGYQPPLATLEHWLSANPHAAIKLAPATVPPSAWQAQYELEWISRNRQCRQLVVYAGDLARVPGQRRATRITGSSDGRTYTSSTLTGEPGVPAHVSSAPGRYVFDPDAAVIAAHLTGELAAQLELKSLGPGAVYLTSDRLPGGAPDPSRLCSAFEVTARLPLRRTAIAAHLRSAGIGRVELKQRGVQYDLPRLSRQLKLSGDGSAALLLTRIGTQHCCLVTKRCTNVD